MRGVLETSTAYVGAGERNQSVRVVSIDKTNPANVKEVLFSLASLGLDGRLDVYWIVHVEPAGGYAVLGRTRPLPSPPPGASPGTAFLLRLDEQFQKMATFGNSGVAYLSHNGLATSQTRCERVRVTYNANGAFSGFVVAGAIPRAPGSSLQDMFIETLDTVGKRIASKTLSITDLDAIGMPPLTLRTSLCPLDVPSLETTNAIAFDVAQVPGSAERIHRRRTAECLRTLRSKRLHQHAPGRRHRLHRSHRGDGASRFETRSALGEGARPVQRHRFSDAAGAGRRRIPRRRKRGGQREQQGLRPRDQDESVGQSAIVRPTI